MLLPPYCSIKINGVDCKLSPSHIVSIDSHDGEYMVGVVCNSHVEEMKKRLLAMQSVGALSEGKIKLQPVKMVMTDCVRVDNEYNIELDYKINSKNVRNPNLSL